MRNKKKASRLEILADSLIPLALILAVAVTIIEVSFSSIVKKYFILIDTIEGITIAIFVLDLFFKYRHTKSIPDFLKHYWIYIIAIFPFFLVFRIIEKISTVTITAEQTPLWIKSVATILKDSRVVGLSGTFRFLSISSRMVRAFYFYENPRVRHKINLKKMLKLP